MNKLKYIMTYTFTLLILGGCSAENPNTYFQEERSSCHMQIDELELYPLDKLGNRLTWYRMNSESFNRSLTPYYRSKELIFEGGELRSEVDKFDGDSLFVFDGVEFTTQIALKYYYKNRPNNESGEGWDCRYSIFEPINLCFALDTLDSWGIEYSECFRSTCEEIR